MDRISQVAITSWDAMPLGSLSTAAQHSRHVELFIYHDLGLLPGRFVHGRRCDQDYVCDASFSDQGDHALEVVLVLGQGHVLTRGMPGRKS